MEDNQGKRSGAFAKERRLNSVHCACIKGISGETGKEVISNSPWGGQLPEQSATGWEILASVWDLMTHSIKGLSSPAAQAMKSYVATTESVSTDNEHTRTGPILDQEKKATPPPSHHDPTASAPSAAAPSQSRCLPSSRAETQPT